jgi:tRNA dimethylallyltransferase
MFTSHSDPLHQAIYLTGPTASGKSAISLALAERLNAEIISLDSMAIFRGMDIGTAKPTLAERKFIQHHLIDILDPHEEFSVAQYRRRALETAEEIQNRGKVALFVGGTPLYLKTLLRGLYEGPPADWDFRSKLEERVAAYGIEVLHSDLQKVDPAAAKKIYPQDIRRVIRALEVFDQIGTPLSELQQEFNKPIPRESVRVFCFDWPRATLHTRINERVDQMFSGGLIEEVEHLLRQPNGLGRTARQAVGYHEVIEHLEEQVSLATTIEKVKAGTRQFAKRQCTWFRGLSECRMIARDELTTTTQLCERILAEI